MEGFWLSQYLRQINVLSQLSLTRKVQSLLTGDLETHYASRVPLEGVKDAIKRYNKNMSAGKVCVCPQMSAEEAGSGEGDAASGAAAGAAEE